MTGSQGITYEVDSEHRFQVLRSPGPQMLIAFTICMRSVLISLGEGSHPVTPWKTGQLSEDPLMLIQFALLSGLKLMPEPGLKQLPKARVAARTSRTPCQASPAGRHCLRARPRRWGMRGQPRQRLPVSHAFSDCALTAHALTSRQQTGIKQTPQLVPGGRSMPNLAPLAVFPSAASTGIFLQEVGPCTRY